MSAKSRELPIKAAAMRRYLMFEISPTRARIFGEKEKGNTNVCYLSMQSII